MRKKIPKTRNNGTMTESAFWSFIRSALRRRTIVWKPISKARENARRKYTGNNPRRKWEYECNGCKKCFAAKEITVDHIIPAGKLRSSKDLPGFIERLFCEVDGFQVLCKECHDIKTKADKIKIKQND